MNLAIALSRIYPGASQGAWIVRDDSDGKGAYIARWNLPDPQPTQTELEEAWQEWLTEQAETEYLRQRLAEYKAAFTIDEFIEAVFEKLAEADSVKFDAIQAKREAIKAKYPVPQ